MGNESSANKEKTSSKKYQNGNTIQEQQNCEPSEYFNRRRGYRRICGETSVEEGEVGYRTKMETGCTAEVDRRLKKMKHLSLGIVRMHMVDWERESMEIRMDVWLPGFSSLVTCHSRRTAGPAQFEPKPNNHRLENAMTLVHKFRVGFDVFASWVADTLHPRFLHPTNRARPHPIPPLLSFSTPEPSPP
ncbi:hypothetical protein BJ912DRAFT_1042404 [Pholiota molesta]|nr:hypothetical protein BJ912DRAFT_1042404 [Pholiota molesta]